MRSDFNKVYLPIDSRHLLTFPLEVFGLSPLVDRVVVVARSDDRARAAELIESAEMSKPTQVVVGGASRQESEHNGLASIADEIDTGRIDLVAIHDGARPFVTLELIERLVTKAEEIGGAIPGLPNESPLYRVEGGRARPLVQERLRRVQTPQVFRARPLLAAYRRAAEAGFSGVDTAETARRFGSIDVAMVPGDDRNIKVTFVEDMFVAEELATRWDAGRWADRE